MDVEYCSHHSDGCEDMFLSHLNFLELHHMQLLLSVPEQIQEVRTVRLVHRIKDQYQDPFSGK